MSLYLIRRRTPRSIYEQKVQILWDYVKKICITLATKVRNIPYLVLQHKQVQILQMDSFMHGGVHGCLFKRKNTYRYFYQNGKSSRILNNIFVKISEDFYVPSMRKEADSFSLSCFIYL